MTDRPAIVIQADRSELLRCRCPECLTLDRLHPGEGYQLALIVYRPFVSKLRRRPPRDKA